MNFNFKKIGDLNVSLLKEKLLNINENIWKESQIRQKNFQPHIHTETIELMWDLESLDSNKPGKKSTHYQTFEIDGLLENLKTIYSDSYGEGDFIRVLLVKLKKNSNIALHIDTTDSLDLCRRTHIPVITNDMVFFTVHNETKVLREGEIWEINNTKPHSVQNESEFDRIHFIIDYLQKK